MEDKTAFISARLTPSQRLMVKAVAAMDGKTISQLIEEGVVNKAVQRLRPADSDEVASDSLSPVA